MAIHKSIDLTNTNIQQYVFIDTKSDWKTMYDFLDQLGLRPYCFQHKENMYTCWYFGFSDIKKPYVLHLNINKKSFRMWFRRPEYLTQNGLEKTKIDKKYRYISFYSLDVTIKNIITTYIEKIKKPLHIGLVNPDKIDKHKNC